VIPSPFEYTAPETIQEAVGALQEGGEDAKILAGGHSLVPLMRLRLAAPALLVDLRRVPGLSGVQRENGHWRIGTMTRHAEVQDREDLGAYAAVAHGIADQQVRNRGTVGGSMAHGDPASDWPTAMLAAEGSVTAMGPSGPREIPAAELFLDYLTTSVAPDEVVTEVRLPALDGWSWGYEKFTRRAEDWAMVGVLALVQKAGDGTVGDVRIALTNMGSTPLRASAAEAALRGRPLDAATIAEAAGHAAEGTSPPADRNASADYKRHLAQALTKRALTTAAGGS
jgi:carbon-monoxide dehydrogenase medium subunit